MKRTAPVVPPIRQDGRKEPKWLSLVYAIGIISLIIMWAYILSSSK